MECILIFKNTSVKQLHKEIITQLNSMGWPLHTAILQSAPNATDRALVSAMFTRRLE